MNRVFICDLEGFYVPPGYDSLLFVLALLSYVAVLLGNGLVVSIIVLDKSLHRPMFTILIILDCPFGF
uniref:G-protein coupled receptors family 1 profile domain-containing protein n=1 Tax=Acanthochromis polyacanthus TaxID=80966 RepID=A0A3Q1FJQ8_9TELE